MGVDRDVITSGRDRTGRAEVETTTTADDVRARMRAKFLIKFDVARLVEGAGEIARLDDRAQNGSSIARISAKITVAQIVRREERRIARDIEYNIAMRQRAVTAWAENERMT